MDLEKYNLYFVFKIKFYNHEKMLSFFYLETSGPAETFKRKIILVIFACDNNYFSMSIFISN